MAKNKQGKGKGKAPAGGGGGGGAASAGGGGGPASASAAAGIGRPPIESGLADIQSKVLQECSKVGFPTGIIAKAVLSEDSLLIQLYNVNVSGSATTRRIGKLTKKISNYIKRTYGRTPNNISITTDKNAPDDLKKVLARFKDAIKSTNLIPDGHIIFRENPEYEKPDVLAKLLQKTHNELLHLLFSNIAQTPERQHTTTDSNESGITGATRRIRAIQVDAVAHAERFFEAYTTIRAYPLPGFASDKQISHSLVQVLRLVEFLTNKSFPPQPTQAIDSSAAKKPLREVLLELYRVYNLIDEGCIYALNNLLAAANRYCQAFKIFREGYEIWLQFVNQVDRSWIGVNDDTIRNTEQNFVNPLSRQDTACYKVLQEHTQNTITLLETILAALEERIAERVRQIQAEKAAESERKRKERAASSAAANGSGAANHLHTEASAVYPSFFADPSTCRAPRGKLKGTQAAPDGAAGAAAAAEPDEKPQAEQRLIQVQLGEDTHQIDLTLADTDASELRSLIPGAEVYLSLWRVPVQFRSTAERAKLLRQDGHGQQGIKLYANFCAVKVLSTKERAIFTRHNIRDSNELIYLFYKIVSHDDYDRMIATAPTQDATLTIVDNPPSDHQPPRAK